MSEIPGPGELPDVGSWRAATPLGERAAALLAARASRTLLATDFDGTLSPIVADPRQARMDPAARAELAALAPHLLQLAVVTGREVAVARELGELDTTPGFEKLVVMGQYGQETWDAATGRLDVPPAPPGVRAALGELEELLAGGDEDLDGVSLEDKGRAIGVHTRRAADPQAAFVALQQPLAEVAERHGLLLEPGRNVIELRSSATSKADALDALLARCRPDVVVMMGDDLGDLPAFARVKSLAEQGTTGICVVAASAEQPAVAAQADVLCGGPQGVAAWLAAVNQALTDSGEPDGGADTTVAWEQARHANRELWDDRAVLHEGLYDAHDFASDPEAVTSVVRDDLPVLLQHLPTLDGASLLHLQCHIGTDSISLARQGARVTGLDFSAAALEVAGRLAAEAGQQVSFVQSDVLAAREAVTGDFDVVYTSIGTIVWLDDLATWAHQVAALLRPGGVFYIRDGHPMLLALDEAAEAPVVGYRYFANGQAQTWNDGATYAGEGTTAHTRSYEWPHAISEIVGSLLAAGLVLERFDEGTTLPWRFSALMTEQDGSWVFGPQWRSRIPCTYTIVARKPTR